MSKIAAVSTEHAPSPLGHYRQAVRAGGFIHVSGQLPVVTAEGAPGSQAAPFEAQAKLVLENFLAIIAAAGAGPADVVRVTAYVVGSAGWPALNRTFAEAFGDHLDMVFPLDRRGWWESSGGVTKPAASLGGPAR